MALCLHQRYGMSKAPPSERSQHVNAAASEKPTTSFDLYMNKRRRIETYESVKKPKEQ